jgi:hypothetical protein
MLKNLLTLAAFAALSITASAGNTVDILDSFGGCGWGSTYDSATKTITYTGEWSGRGWWIGGKDYSDYESIVVKFAEPITDYAQIVVEYTDNSYSNSTSGKNAGATEIECSFDKDGRAAIAQIYIQSKSAGTIVLSEAYLVVEDTGATEKVLFEGTFEDQGEWWPGYTISKQDILTQGAGSKLVVDVEYPESDTSWSYKLALNWGGTILPSFQKLDNFTTSGNVAVVASKSTSYLFTEDDIATIKADNSSDSYLRIQIAKSTIIKKVTLVYPTDESIAQAGVNSVIAADNENAPVEYYNLQGVRVSNPANGLYIRRQGNQASKVLIK